MWKYIESLDWYDNSKKAKGYENIKTFILTNYTEKLTEDIRKFISARYNELYYAIEKYEEENGRAGQYSGDDSHGDMIQHAIGLGEDYFNSVVNNPAILDDLKIVESFGYAIPYEDDFKKLDLSYHKNLAIKALQSIVEIMAENKPSVDDIETMRQMQNRFMFMAAGDLAEATRGFNDSRYDEYYKFESNNHMAMFSNMLSDAQKVAHLVK